MLLTVLAFVLSWISQADGKVSIEFTKNPGEHIINIIHEPIKMRAVKGRLESQAGEWPKTAFVVFEMKGPLPLDRMWRAYPKKPSGRFEIRHVPVGEYRFKATAIGWQSVEGTIVVSKEPEAKDAITLQMPLGE